MKFSLGEFRATFVIGCFWLGAVSAFSALQSNWVWVITCLLLSGIGWWKLPKYRNLLALLMLAFTLAFGISVFRVTSILNTDLPASAKVLFQVLEDPKLVSSYFSLAGEKEVSVLVDVSVSRSLTAPVLMRIKDTNFMIAKISSVWSCEATFENQEKPRRYSGFGECTSGPIAVVGPQRLQVIADEFRAGLRSVTSDKYSSEAAALLPGLVLGDTSAQSPRMEQTLQAAGLGHLTAVSGANVAIVLLGMEILLRFTRFSIRTRLIVLGLGAMFFMVVVRPSPSVVRATAMAALGLVSVWFGKPKLTLAILNISVLLLLALDPFLAVSIGFQLSVAATFGLIVLPKFWKVQVDSSLIWKLFTTAMAAVLATLPILVAADMQPTFASVPANMLAEGLVAPATLAGVLAAVLAVASGIPLVGGLLDWLAQYSADFALFPAAMIMQIAKWAESSIFQVSIESKSGLISLGFLIIGGIWLKRKGWGLTAISVLLSLTLSAVLLIESRASRWGSIWDVAVCDVGQGDATVLRNPDGRVIVIDAGPDEVRFKECLHKLNVSSIELFIASHFHADHVSGVTVLKDFGIQSAWFPNSLWPVSMFEFVKSELEGIPTSFPVAGEVVQLGDWTIRVLQSPQIPETQVGSEINNASLVVVAIKNGRQILFTGDIEEVAQTELMQKFPAVDFDLIKVPHHGSAAQNPDFAKWSNAELGWISAGVDNPYGHPAPQTIAQYKSVDVVLYSTIDCGQIGFKQVVQKWEVMANQSCNPL